MRKLFRKLVDLPEGANATHERLQKFLEAEQIKYDWAHATDPMGRDMFRYMVHASNLERARKIIPDLRHELLGAQFKKFLAEQSL